ncbi:hypothetical protein MY11210_007461 [Beauveria gryllotalpidicola]
MKFVVFASLIASALAVPAELAPRTGSYNACSSFLHSSAQCCATDALGVVGLDCHVPPKAPWSAEDFRKICAEGGQKAKCCLLAAAGQAVLCQNPVGVP